MRKLLKLALDSLLRQRERSAFTILGLALAIATVVLVYAISLRFEGSSTDSVLMVTEGGNVWLVPDDGFSASNRTQFIQTGRRLEPGATGALDHAAGVHVVRIAIAAELDIEGRTLALYGPSDVASGSAVLGSAAASVLRSNSDGTITIAGRSLHVERIDPSIAPTLVVVSFDDAAAITGDNRPSWVVANLPDVRAFAASSQTLTVTSDPSVQVAAPGTAAIAYALDGQLDRFDVFSFKTKFGATILNKATSTIFGQIALITLLLGFLLAISSALMTIEERRVEFGILAAVGITDDVLYLFLAESAIVFIAGFVLGGAFGSLAFAAFLPALFDGPALIKALLIVSTYIPAMLILGALIPLNRLLQRTPLELLRSAA